MEALAAAGQVTDNAALVYDQHFVPALFQQWVEPVLDTAGVGPGARVLDVATGTGIVARGAAQRVGPTGRVVGVDINEGMLAVARDRAPWIPFRTAAAEALPFPDASFDHVVCQFGLMFFDDRAQAVAEMGRVLRPGGTLAVAVWDALETSPGYAAMVGLLQRCFGAGVANALRAPFCLGDPDALRPLFVDVDTRLRACKGTARFPSLESWVRTDVRGWTYDGAIDDAQLDWLVDEARTELAPFVGPDGTVAFDAPAILVGATSRG